MEKGIEREKSLSKEEYLSEGYFSLRQWHSFCFQAGAVYKLLHNGNILEIGAGSGFVGGVLRSIGFTVESLDVNEHLLPTHIGDISSEDFNLDKKYDCVLCAEVLEHIPIEKFDVCLKNIKRLSKRYVIITLPNCESDNRFSIQLNSHVMGFKLGRKRASIAAMHFWELNSDKDCTYEKIREKIKNKYNILEEGKVLGNEYHYYYILEF